MESQSSHALSPYCWFSTHLLWDQEHLVAVISPPLTGGNCAGPGCCRSEELPAQDEHKSLLWVGLSTYNTHGVSPE